MTASSMLRSETARSAAGDIARKLGVPHNTMSAHLAILARAGWVVSQRQSRQIIYRASLSHMATVIRFLLTDCCGGHPELCATLIDSLGGCGSTMIEKNNFFENATVFEDSIILEKPIG